jgi:hypothetical protein
LNTALDDMTNSARQGEETMAAENGEEEHTAVRKFIGSFIVF